MKVAALIALLQAENPNADVLLDVNEDWGNAKKVYTKEQVEQLLYFKGASPAEAKQSDYIMIADQ
jgi:hypothetical protein